MMVYCGGFQNGAIAMPSLMIELIEDPELGGFYCALT